MNDGYVTLTFTQPELSDWQCELFGTGPGGLVLRPQKGREPNWFWRWMQFLAFGNRWHRVPPVRAVGWP